MNLLQNLRVVVAALALEPNKPGPITTNGPASSFLRARLTGEGMIGIKISAAEPFQNLVEGMFEADDRYKRGITYKEFEDEAFQAVLELFYENPPAHIGGAELKALEARLAQHFLPNFDAFTTYVPCAITTASGVSFAIGPVQFQWHEAFNLDQFATSFIADDLRRLRAMMTAQNAGWVATVPVRDVHEKRAGLLGDLVVDVALAVLQVIVPLSNSRHMARMYDLRGPGLRIVLKSNGSRVTGSYHAADQPGFGLMPEVLGKMLRESPQLLGAAGLHLTGLANNSFSHPTLQMAWCDAAYWFRQGVRDNLDAIAVTKLETALEVMLSAASTTIGRDRMYRAIEAFYGRKRADFLNSDSTTTIKQFVESLVSDRSRVLHGTYSTLATPMAVSRGILESFCRDMLRAMAAELERYIATSGADDIDAFLAWAPSTKHAPTA